MALFITSLIFFGLGFFCQSPMARSILWGAAILALFAGASFYWVDDHLTAAGCTGPMLEGPSCPDPSLLTRFAMAHLRFGILTFVSGVFAAPTIVLIALWIEFRQRRRLREV